MATAKKKVSGIKKSNPTHYADKTMDTYALSPGSFGWGYEVNKLTSVRGKGKKAGKPLTATKDVVYRSTSPLFKGSAYSGAKTYRDSYVEIPSVERQGFSGTVSKAGVVGPKSVISTNASRKNIQVTRKRDEAMRRGSKNPKAGR